MVVKDVKNLLHLKRERESSQLEVKKFIHFRCGIRNFNLKRAVASGDAIQSTAQSSGAATRLVEDGRPGFSYVSERGREREVNKLRESKET